MLAKHKIKNDNEHGSARFSTFQEIKSNFSKENINSIKEVGFPIWFSKDLKSVWFDKETPHWVFLGSTGSGKSVTAVIPECSFISSAKEKRSVFITDPKGEIFNTTSKMFRERGYNVLTIDFRHPEYSNKFNILQPIINEYKLYLEFEKKRDEIKEDSTLKTEYNNKAMSHYAETNRLITSLSNMIMQEKVQQKDPFWNNSARQLLEGIIGLFLEEYKLGNIKEKQITMTSIRKFQNSSKQEKNLKKFKSYIEKKVYGSKSKDSLTSILSASDNTMKSITAVFVEKMALFDDINVANVTSESNFILENIGKEPTVLYVIVPDEDKTYFTLVTIIVGLLYRELVKVANNQPNKKLPVQMDWLLDEFANCPPLSDIEAIVSVARSRGMRFQFFIQSFSQLDNVYGKEVSQIILDNCGLVYLKTNTQDTAEAISKRLGKKTIESNSISQSVSLMNYNGNKSTSLMARDLLTPDEVKQLHYKTIIFPITGYPIFRDTVVYQKFSCYKKGEIKRKLNNLKDLSDTYFTVEQIDHEVTDKKGKMKPPVVRKEVDEFTSELQNFQKEQFGPVIEIFDKIFKNVVYEILFLEENDKIYMRASFDKIPNGNIVKLKTKIPKDLYHLEITKERDNTIVDVHLKTLVIDNQKNLDNSMR